MKFINKFLATFVQKKNEEIMLQNIYYINEEREKLEEENYTIYLNIFLQTFNKISSKKIKKYIMEIELESNLDKNNTYDYTIREERGKKMAIRTFMDILNTSGYNTELKNIKPSSMEKRKLEILIEDKKKV